MRNALALAARQYGFELVENGLAFRASGDGIDWVFQISSNRRFGVQYCWADCGLRDDSAMRAANVLWRKLDKRAEALPEIVVPLISADRWFQGCHYREPAWIRYNRHPEEPLSAWYSRAVQDTWERGKVTWDLFKTRRDLFDLLDRAEDPFPGWASANGVLCAFLFLQLAEFEGLGIAACLPTLERLWTVIVNSSGLPDLRVDNLIELFEHRLH